MKPMQGRREQRMRSRRSGRLVRSIEMPSGAAAPQDVVAAAIAATPTAAAALMPEAEREHMLHLGHVCVHGELDCVTALQQ